MKWRWWQCFLDFFLHFYLFLGMIFIILIVLRKIGKFQWDLNYDVLKYKNLGIFFIFLVFLQGEFFFFSCRQQLGKLFLVFFKFQ